MNKKFKRCDFKINKIVSIVLGSIGLLLVISSIPVKFLLLVIGITLIVLSVLLITIK